MSNLAQQSLSKWPQSRLVSLGACQVELHCWSGKGCSWGEKGRGASRENYLEEAEITMMEVMFKSETITEKRDNLNGAFWQMNFIDKVENLKYVEMCDGDQIKGP